MVLDNGLRVFLLEDHEVPLVKATLLMKGGARASPPDKVPLPYDFTYLLVIGYCTGPFTVAALTL